MTSEKPQLHTDRRERLIEIVQRELARFEQRENEFRQRDRAERAAELRLPAGWLDRVH
jgi:hypothetical protein